MVNFEVDAIFGSDYLYFHQQFLDDSHSDQETADIIELLALPPHARVLDVPCGHGRISNRLAASGWQAIGLDISSEFIAMGCSDSKERGDGAQHVEGDMRELPFAGQFEAVVCWNGSFGYFDDDDNRQVLNEFHRVLRPGGCLLIETMQHDSFVRHFTIAPDAQVIEVGDDAMIDLCTFDVMTGKIEVDRTVIREGQTRRSRHHVRVPTVSEWRSWLTDVGFTELRFTERSGAPLTLESWTQVVRAIA